jgi:hypothetical protein
LLGHLRRRLPTKLIIGGQHNGHITSPRRRDRELTILDPRVTKGVDTLSLVLSNDHVPDGRSGQEVKHSIRIRAFSLLIASSLAELVTLHPSIEGLARLDVDCLVESYGLSWNRELRDRERETWWRTSIEVALGCVCTSLGSIAVLATDHCRCGERREEREDNGSGELHDEGPRRGI